MQLLVVTVYPAHLMWGPRYSFTGFILQTTTSSSRISLCRMSPATTGSWLPAPRTRETAPGDAFPLAFSR